MPHLRTLGGQQGESPSLGTWVVKRVGMPSSSTPPQKQEGEKENVEMIVSLTFVQYAFSDVSLGLILCKKLFHTGYMHKAFTLCGIC